ncbi:uncharacterized protein LOC135716215 [Ochlerotatus camptorhynchus]|uniref:uncharacterized protein LOC135716215 n=1 Tax=Ochlerotatus camptorhynchus TaxID=644619 RepID=UPI0031E3FCE4
MGLRAEKIQKLTFVGYSAEHKAYRFLDRSTKKVIVSRDARFIDGTPVARGPENTSSNTVEFEFHQLNPPDPQIVEEDADADAMEDAVEDLMEESDDSFHGFSDEDHGRRSWTANEKFRAFD